MSFGFGVVEKFTCWMKNEGFAAFYGVFVFNKQSPSKCISTKNLFVETTANFVERSVIGLYHKPIGLWIGHVCTSRDQLLEGHYSMVPIFKWLFLSMLLLLPLISSQTFSCIHELSLWCTKLGPMCIAFTLGKKHFTQKEEYLWKGKSSPTCASLNGNTQVIARINLLQWKCASVSRHEASRFLERLICLRSNEWYSSSKILSTSAGDPCTVAIWWSFRLRSTIKRTPWRAWSVVSRC